MKGYRWILLAVLIFLYISGLLIPEDALQGSFLEAGQAPSLSHLFGTDALGRDLFLRTIKGLSISMTVGITASLVSAVAAALVGLAAALGRGGADALAGWLIDLFMSVPHTVLVILISFVMGKGFRGLLVGIALTHWCSLARLIRGEICQLRSSHYVEVSRRFGKTEGWIFVHHFLPQLGLQFLAGLVLLFPHAILHEAAISFLGFGLPPEQPAVGIILAESMRYLSAGMWWPALFPGAMLMLLVWILDRLGEELCRLPRADQKTVEGGNG